MSTYYMVHLLPGSMGHDYPDYLERLLGEKPGSYRNLVPPLWLNYGLDGQEARP